METYAVPLGALIVSLATLIFTGLTLRGKAQEAHVQTVEQQLTLRVSDLSREVEECKKARDRFEQQIGVLRDENLTLLQKLVKLENGGH